MGANTDPRIVELAKQRDRVIVLLVREIVNKKTTIPDDVRVSKLRSLFLETLPKEQLLSTKDNDSE